MLDTNIFFNVMKRPPLKLLGTFNKYAGLLNLLRRALSKCEKSSRSEQNRLAVENFVSRLVILKYGEKAAQHYGEIRAALELRGKIKDVNYLHISVHTRSEKLTVVTNNLREFEQVNELRRSNCV